jgi:uncharacterized membrane protein
VVAIVWHRGICVAAALLLLLTAATASAAADPADVSDADALALTQKHCVMCHARKPTHPSFDAPPKTVVLETIDELRAWAPKMLEQVVQDRNMPIGSEMTDDARAMLARWIERQGSWKPR